MSRKWNCIHWLSPPIILVRPTDLSLTWSWASCFLVRRESFLFKIVNNHQFPKLFWAKPLHYSCYRGENENHSLIMCSLRKAIQHILRKHLPHTRRRARHESYCLPIRTAAIRQGSPETWGLLLALADHPHRNWPSLLFTSTALFNLYFGIHHSHLSLSLLCPQAPPHFSSPLHAWVLQSRTVAPWWPQNRGCPGPISGCHTKSAVRNGCKKKKRKEMAVKLNLLKNLKFFK